MQTASTYFNNYLPLVWLFIFLSFSSCSVSQKTAKKKDEKKPAWVTSRPVDKNYYQGIGVAVVNNYTQGHVEEAKKKALNDIISEISVNVKSSSTLQRIEENDELNSMYQSVTKLTAENDIEGYELYDSWGDNQSYWVYYRLSKEHYNQNKLRRINRATAQATQFYEAGNKALEGGDYARAYSDFVKGLMALRDYLDAEITINTNNGKEYLVDALMAQLIEMNRSLTFSTDRSDIKVRVARPVETPVDVMVTFKGQPVGNLPVKPFFSKGGGEVPASLVTGENGQASVKIQRVTGGQHTQLLEISPDIESMTGEEEGQQLIAKLIRLKCNVPVVKVNVETTRIVAYLESHELEFGRPSENRLTKAMKKHLSDNGYSFSESRDNVDAIVKFSVTSKEGEEILLKNVTLFTAYVDCFITITDVRTGNQVYYKGFSREKGSRAGGFDQALRDAEDNVLERFKTELLPEINNIDL